MVLIEAVFPSGPSAMGIYVRFYSGDCRFLTIAGNYFRGVGGVLGHLESVFYLDFRAIDLHYGDYFYPLVNVFF